MAVATYGTDLNPVVLCEDTTGWAEMTGRTSGGAATQEDRAYIQGSYAVSQSTGAATGATMGLQYDYGSNIAGWTAGWVFLFWQYWQAPKAMNTWANGGLRIGVGSTTGNTRLWNAQGNDYGRNPYGGWANTAIDPTYNSNTGDETIGSPVNGNYRIFCSAPNLLQAVSKGNPHCVDAIRYGRGQIKVELGDAGGYGTFSGLAAANDADSARWGLFSYQMGSYLWKGLLSLGTASNPVHFIDTAKTVFIEDTPRTYADFNKIEIRHASSQVYLTNVNFVALGTLSKGRLSVVNDCTIAISNCLFSGMDTFVFQSLSNVTDCVFLNCGQITANDASFVGSSFSGYTGAADSSQLIWDTAADTDLPLVGCTFTKGASATHAVNLGTTSPTSVTFRTCTFNNYNASNEQNDSTILVSRMSGSVTINVINCTGNVSYKRVSGSTATVTITPNPKTLTLTGLVTLSDIVILEAGTTTELVNIDQNVGSTYGYNYTTGAGNSVDIGVFKRGYVPFYIRNYTLPTGDMSLPIAQVVDRNYNDPA